MTEAITRNIDRISKLCEKCGEESIFVFGYAASCRLGEDSDIDFLVDFSELSIEDYTDNYFTISKIFSV